MIGGTLLPDVAKTFGFAENIKVAAGAEDNAAAAIGTSTVGSDKCNISPGTSGTIFMTSDKFCVDRNNAIHSFCHADGGYHLMGERSPINDTDATGLFIGLRPDTKREHMFWYMIQNCQKRWFCVSS